MTATEQGCIDIWIDEIVPCLKDTVTGDIKEYGCISCGVFGNYSEEIGLPYEFIKFSKSTECLSANSDKAKY